MPLWNVRNMQLDWQTHKFSLFLRGLSCTLRSFIASIQIRVAVAFALSPWSLTSLQGAVFDGPFRLEEWTQSRLKALMITCNAFIIYIYIIINISSFIYIWMKTTCHVKRKVASFPVPPQQIVWTCLNVWFKIQFRAHVGFGSWMAASTYNNRPQIRGDEIVIFPLKPTSSLDQLPAKQRASPKIPAATFSGAGHHCFLPLLQVSPTTGRIRQDRLVMFGACGVGVGGMAARDAANGSLI